jgi:hypothetical protein
MFQGATPSEGQAAGGHYIDDVTRSFALLLLAAAPAAAEPCKPHAQLEGDAAAVATVTAELVKLGVVVGQSGADGAPTGCKTVFAAVELGRDGGLAIAVKTGTQSEGRTVSDAVVAASWIDSWVADDFAPPHPAPNGFFDLRPAPAYREAETEAAMWRDARIYPSLGLSVSAAFDQAWSFDRTRWTGFSGGACVQVNALCFGARGRYATQDILVGQTAATRSDFALLATASYTKQLGRTQLVPELGLGVGRMTTDRVNGCRHLACDPHDQGCMEPPPDMECVEHDPEHAYTLALDDHMHITSVTPRVAASVRLAVALADHLYLDGVAGFTLAPFGHDDPYGLPLGETPPPGVAPQQVALPGQSIGTFELGLGLRWGYR